MLTVHRLTIPQDLPDDLAQVLEFLRVMPGDEDQEVSDMIATAAAELEQLAELALLSQAIRVTCDGWPEGGTLRLPIGPVLADAAFDATADGQPLEAQLIPGLRPHLRLAGEPSSTLHRAHIVVEYQAGFGPAAGAIPADIRGAIRDQVAVLHYERGASAVTSKARNVRGIEGMSHAMQRVIGRYRGVRV